MRSLTRVLGALLLCATASCASSDGAADPTTTTAGGPTTSVISPTSTPSTTASTVPSSTSSSTTTTSTTEPRPDGVRSPEDAAVLVITSWVGADRDTAARHASTAALDTLFAVDPPEADAVEFIECDSSDLIRFDCFFAVDGTIVILGVVDLQVTDATVDSD